MQAPNVHPMPKKMGRLHEGIVKVLQCASGFVRYRITSFIAAWVVAPNEMPNFPYRELDKTGHCALAKFKEDMLALRDR